jgi:hypothetical protein
VPLLTPRTSPALERGSSLYSGDYIYNCLSDPKSKGKDKDKDAASCSPTFLHLKDDGTLVLARGTTPSKPYRTLWQSKTPKPCGGKCSCQGNYEAVYGTDGSLEVRRACGKRVWRKRKFFQPRVLRPWPLAK